MHILFVHNNFPAQFGQIAYRLANRPGYRCSYVSMLPAGKTHGVERLQYTLKGGATEQNHYCSRSFENLIWHSHAIYETLAARTDIQPDLIVAHSGFLSTVFLRELYKCPIINYFEFYYHTIDSDMDFRTDRRATPLQCLRARARNASLLLDLDNCDMGYSATHWQRSQLPVVYQPKVRVLFDGIDTDFWQPRSGLPRRIGERVVPDDVRIVTYVSRGFESMRGFDIFMKAAKKLCELRNDVVFAVVGDTKVFYGGDEDYTGGKSFKDWVLDQDEYDLSRILFLGRLSPQDLAQLLAISDLHIYLTVPFVLSWSVLNALASGTTILASDTAPVREVIKDGKTGLLTDFFDVDALTVRAMNVLDAPREYKYLGVAGRHLVEEQYSMQVCLPQHIRLYDEVMNSDRGVITTLGRVLLDSEQIKVRSPP